MQGFAGCCTHLQIQLLQQHRIHQDSQSISVDRDYNQPSCSWVVYTHSPTAFSEKESVQIIQHVLGRYWFNILRWMSNKAGTHEYSTNASQSFLTYSKTGYLHECACKSCLQPTYELLSSATYVSLRWTSQVLLLRRERFLLITRGNN